MGSQMGLFVIVRQALGARHVRALLAAIHYWSLRREQSLAELHVLLNVILGSKE